MVAHTLGAAGRLAEIKVFTRSDAAVTVAPFLFGRHPGDLLRDVEAVCAHHDAIPLVGVAAARERAYAPACVIANESAIATKVALQANRDNAAAVPQSVVEAANAANEETLERSLSDGQRAMIASVCSSGRGAELILGVAGAGKTTALDVVREAFEIDGYTVIGASTSGSKVVLVGDHRQLGAVGPGGTLEGLVARYSDAVHVLDQNVRQADPAERAALAERRRQSRRSRHLVLRT